MQKEHERVRISHMRDTALAVRVGMHANQKTWNQFFSSAQERPKISGYSFFKSRKPKRGRRGKQK